MTREEESSAPPARSDAPFLAGLCALGGFYALLLAAMLAADASFIGPGDFRRALASPEIRYSIRLSLLSCSLTALLSLWVAIPVGYLMSRFQFPMKALADSLLDIPIVLPPLVIGLSLLILFQTAPGRAAESAMRALSKALLGRESGFTYRVPGVILAQFMVACAFAVRAMRAAFDQIGERRERVALTLGCSRGQAFWAVALPQAWRGVLTAGTLAWARSLGEFGPILVFAGATRMRTEVLPTTVFLELSVGNIEAAVAVSIMMVCAAVATLAVVRIFGREALLARGVEPEGAP